MDRDADGTPRHPDRLVIDLDPGEPAGLHECAQVALLVRDALAERDLGCTPVTSGSKGLHLYAPMPAGRAWTATAPPRWPRRSPRSCRRSTRDLVTATMTKAKRPGKVFLDWSQNSGSKTTISPYSLRGASGPPPPRPLTWDEVEEGAEDDLALDQFTLAEVLERVGGAGRPLRGLSAPRAPAGSCPHLPDMSGRPIFSLV